MDNSKLESDLVLDPALPIPSMNDPFDINKYLSHSQIGEIAEKVCTERMTVYVDQILENRSFGEAGRITDLILMKTAESYVSKLSAKFEADFLKICNEEINKPIPNEGESHVSAFRDGIIYKLQAAAEVWIDANRTTVDDLMKDTIKETVKQMTVSDFSSRLMGKINFNSIFREALSETFVNDAKRVASLYNPSYNFGQKIEKQEACDKIVDILISILLPKEEVFDNDGNPSAVSIRFKEKLMAELMPVAFIGGTNQKLTPERITSIMGTPVKLEIDSLDGIEQKDQAIQLYHYNIQTLADASGVACDRDLGYTGEVLELPGITVVGATTAEVYGLLQSAVTDKLENLKKIGAPIPPPFMNGNEFKRLLNQ